MEPEASSPTTTEMLVIDTETVMTDGASDATAGERLRSNAQAFFDGQEQGSRREGEMDRVTSNVVESLTGIGTVQEVDIAWSNLTYTVTVGRRKNATEKRILDGISGTVKCGHLVAVMGPTGSGKTSLINALAGRVPKGGALSGLILVNGKRRHRAVRSISAYVMQDDAMLATLSVRETFMYAARLRLPAASGTEARAKAVDGIIEELGLRKAQHTYIGSAFIRGVSGGERKRTSIGVELLSNPSLLFLDEPTSGLDSFQAQSVMSSLSTLARNRRTIISTIHQPRSSIYQMFDKLLLLSEGRIMFMGQASAATAYFASQAFPCPQEYNPADFFMDVVSMDYRTPDAEKASRERITLLAENWMQDGGAQLAKEVEVMKEEGGGLEKADSRGTTTPAEPGVRRRAYPRSWFVQFLILGQRSFTQTSRDKFPLIASLMQGLFISLLLSATYSEMEKDQKGIQDRTGVLFFISIFVAFNNVLGILNTFPKEKGIINRERNSKTYQVGAYYVSKVVMELPIRLMGTVLFSSIVYWLVGLNDDAGKFFIFLVVLLLMAATAQGLGMLVSAATPSAEVAQAVAPAFMVLLILYGGFYINVDSLPTGSAWVQYLSPMYWCFLALAINDLKDEDGFECDCLEEAPDGSCAVEKTDGCVRTGNEILDRLSLDDDEVWQGVLGLVLLFFGFHLLGYLALRFTKPRFQRVS